eukprot:UN26719
MGEDKGDIVETEQAELKPLTVLKVSDLSRTVHEDHLQEIFSNYGPVESTTIAIHSTAKLPLGHGTVTFQEREDALKAIKHMNGGQIDGRIIQVEEIKPTNENKDKDNSDNKTTEAFKSKDVDMKDTTKSKKSEKSDSGSKSSSKKRVQEIQTRSHLLHPEQEVIVIEGMIAGDVRVRKIVTVVPEDLPTENQIEIENGNDVERATIQ